MSAKAVATGMLLSCTMLSGVAASQSLCVECRGPDRTYSCSVKDSARVAQVRGAGKALEFLCISEIARHGRHESCRAGTTYAGPCIGQPYEIDVARLGAEPPIAAPPTDVPPADKQALAPAAVPARPAAGQPPRTLEELARNTVAKSKEQLSAADRNVRQAGDTVGGTLKKTWDCVASLFSRC